MRELDKGETFIVTRNGIPIGELIPVRRAQFVSAEKVMAAFEGAPPIDAAKFREDLDRYFDQSMVSDD